jgi:hypothetical protein
MTRSYVQLMAPVNDAQIFETIYCTQIQLATLTPEECICPLCSEAYSEVEPNSDTASDPIPSNPDAEHAVRVDFDNCRHVFGHICLQRLIHLEEAWSNWCPLCRTHWFKLDSDSTHWPRTPLHLYDDEDTDDDEYVPISSGTMGEW